MAEGLNKVMLLGSLGADPELKMTQGGTAILKLRLATTERYQDKSGQWAERTEWHSVTVFGKRAESLHKILAKGSSIFVEGSLHTSSYEDREGQKRYRTEVNASKVILSGKGGGERSESRSESRPAQRQQKAPAEEAPEPDDAPPMDDDLPFD